MPNIEIRGFSSEKAMSLKKQINKVLELIGMDEGAITSTINLQAESCGIVRVNQPYLRVCSTRFDEIVSIITAFKKNGIYEDTEFLVLSGFVSKEQLRTGKLSFETEGNPST